MATDVERLAVLIEANTKSYERAMSRIEKKTDQAFRKAGRSAKSLDTGLKAAAVSAASFAKGFALAFASGAGVNAIKRSIDDLDRLAKTADKVGLSIQFLQAIRFGAEQSGVAVQSMDMAMQRFSRRVAEAANGTGELKQVLEANNIQLRDGNGNLRSQESILRDYADLIARAGSEQEALALAFKAFDSEGAAAVNTFRNGSAAIDDYVDGVARLGTVSDDAAREAERLNDAFGRLTHRMTTAFKEAAVGVGGYIKLIVQDIQTMGFALDRLLTNPSLSNLGGLLESVSPVRSGSSEAKKRAAMRRLGGNIQFGAGNQFTRSGAADFYNGVYGQQKKAGIAGLTTDSAAKTAQEQIQKLIQTQEHEIRVLSLSNRQKEIENALFQAGTHATEAQRKKIEELVGTKYDLMQAQDASAQANQFFAESVYSSFSGIITGAESASDAVRNLANSLADAALQAILLGQGPLAGLFGTTATGPSGVGGLLGSFLPQFATGTPYVPRTGPAIVHQGERIIPANQNRPGGMGGGTVVQIINNSGARVTEEKSRTSDGRELRRVMIGDMKKAIASGEMDQAMGSRYGAAPRAVRR